MFVRSLIFKLLKYLISYGNDIQWLTTEELANWLINPVKEKPIILDARSEAEYKISHITNAVRIDTISPDLTIFREISRDREIVVYCSVGYRSATIAHQLQQAGFNQVYNLEGSIFKWANEGRPICKDNRLTEFVHPYNVLWGKLLKSQNRYSEVKRTEDN